MEALHKTMKIEKIDLEDFKIIEKVENPETPLEKQVRFMKAVIVSLGVVLFVVGSLLVLMSVDAM